ncbi:putative prophage regulator protein [Neisseria zoodegmatis]|uniref:Putative prophage regulator protein n=1 Tax=Neisseria zoodegmatis TaxID=326523 RepID=A0A378WJ30_9NEIS|nr:AlpA family phage regulatory protein [Neisseria zoodegmatis]SUA36463.1 putative prophage regulator protein [Neisseria zoodegmatis]
MTTQSILRVKQVAARLGISSATVWYKSNPKSRHYDADFPKPFKISANATGWLESEISGYIEKLAEKRLITEETKHEFTRH